MDPHLPTISRVVRRFLAGLAKEALKEQLGHPAWLRGIGIGTGGRSGHYCVKVNVGTLTNEVRASIPNTVRGVPVLVDEVGDIVAY